MDQPSEQHYDTVAAVGVLVVDFRFLVIKRSQHVIAPGKLCFPGGRVEEGEPIREALLREFHEELQIVIEPVQEIWQSVTSWKCKVHWWQVTSNDLGSLDINRQEVESAIWLTLDELLEHQELLESNREFLERVKQGQISI